VSEWLSTLSLQPQKRVGGRKLRLVTELRGLRFGDHVAENEADDLADYFIETAAFDEVIASRNTLFIGRKGAGKTANMLQAASSLREDARNLVIVIKPQSYELEGLVSLLSRLPRDVKAYTVQSLWSFLLQSEIAKAAVETVELRPMAVPLTDSERSLVEFVDETDFGLREEFAVRFERTVRAIETSGVASASSVGEGRDLLNEALHSEAIRTLRSLIGPVLKGRNRVAILIDNLDKAWDRRSDLEAVSQLLLGLLAAIGRVSVEYQKEDFWRDRVSLSLATFLRSDIYAYLQRVAREPDKIPTTILSWNESTQLLRVIEERFLAARPPGTDPEDLWRKFFCAEVGGRPLKEYLGWRVLPRPRDVVYLCNAATISAVNARREQVLEGDFLSAEQTYSQFAFEALLVENGITISQLEDVLFEFAGTTPIITAAEALEAITCHVNDAEDADSVLARLKAMSFFGVETNDDAFVFPDAGPESKRSEVLARKLADRRGSVARLTIHPAYRPFLEIGDG
jgi:putative transposon-encoded protein